MRKIERNPDAHLLTMKVSAIRAAHHCTVRVDSCGWGQERERFMSAARF